MPKKRAFETHMIGLRMFSLGSTISFVLTVLSLAKEDEAVEGLIWMWFDAEDEEERNGHLSALQEIVSGPKDSVVVEGDDLVAMKALVMRLAMRCESLEEKVKRLEDANGDLGVSLDALKGRLDTLEPMVATLSEIADPSLWHPDSAKEGYASIVAAREAMPEPAFYLPRSAKASPEDWPSITVPYVPAPLHLVLARFDKGDGLTCYEREALAAARAWSAAPSQTENSEVYRVLFLAGCHLQAEYGSEVGRIGDTHPKEKAVFSALISWVNTTDRNQATGLLFAIRNLHEEDTDTVLAAARACNEDTARTRHEEDALAAARAWGGGAVRTKTKELLLAGRHLRIDYGSEAGLVGQPSDAEKAVLLALAVWAAPPVREMTGDLLFVVRRLLEEEAALSQDEKNKGVPDADSV